MFENIMGINMDNTLAKRRVISFEMAVWFIENELEKNR